MILALTGSVLWASLKLELVETALPDEIRRILLADRIEGV